MGACGTGVEKWKRKRKGRGRCCLCGGPGNGKRKSRRAESVAEIVRVYAKKGVDRERQDISNVHDSSGGFLEGDGMS